MGTACADQVLHIDDLSEETEQKEVLQSLFTKLMTVDKDQISEAVSELISRLHLKREVCTKKLVHYLHINLKGLALICAYIQLMVLIIGEGPNRQGGTGFAT